MRRLAALGATLAVLLLLLAAACGDDDDGDSGGASGSGGGGDPAKWAEQMCSAEAAFAKTIAESRDNRDPSSLDLSERKTRAVRLGRVEIDAAKQLVKELRRIKPPNDAKKFHDALIAQANETAEAIEEQVKAIEKANAPQQIAIANAETQFRLQGSTQEVVAASADLPDEIIEAIVDQEQCGVPGVPGGPDSVPTPSARRFAERPRAA